MPEVFLILPTLGLAATLLALFFLNRDYRRIKAGSERTLLEKQQHADALNGLRTQHREAEARAQSLQNQLDTTLERLRSVEQTGTEREQELMRLHQQIDSIQQREQSLHTSVADWQMRTTEHQQTAALYRWMANSAYDALLVLDTKLKVLATNKSANALFGITTLSPDTSLADITQSPILVMMVEDAIVNEEDSLEEQVTVGERSFLICTQIIRDGDSTHIGLALQDITQLIRLNRARRDMVANISHELRTPIANIRLIIDGLFHDQDKPKRKESISSLRAIGHETETLLWLVQEMADLSMIESGQAIIRLVDVPLCEIIDEAAARLEDQMEAKRLKLVREHTEAIHVLCDRDLIQRVIVNLLHNAMKWSPTGGTITLTAEEQEDEAIISIYDNGPGVPEDQVDRIFERFYQMDGSRSGGEGTGLGLAICKHIVTAHGGRIWAESNRTGTGGGRFKFTLLLAEDSAISPVAHDHQLASGNTENGV